MTKDEALRLALEYVELVPDDRYNADHIDRDALITAIKAALEAKDEPVANNWSVFNTGAEVWDKLSLADAVVELTPSRLERGWSAVCVINKDNPPLYTTPSQRKPLTEKQIKEALADMSALQMPLNKLIPAIARAIEAAHGITGENK